MRRHADKLSEDAWSITRRTDPSITRQANQETLHFNENIPTNIHNDTHTSTPPIAGWVTAKACLCLRTETSELKTLEHLFLDPTGRNSTPQSVCVGVWVCVSVCQWQNVDTGLSCLTWVLCDITSFTTGAYLKAAVEPERLHQGIKDKVVALFTPAAHPLTDWRLRRFRWRPIHRT